MPRAKRRDLRSCLVALGMEADCESRLVHVGGLRQDVDRRVKVGAAAKRDEVGSPPPALVGGSGVQSMAR